MIILPDVGVIDHLISGNTVMQQLKDTLTATGLGTEDQYSGLALSTAFYDIGLMLAVSCAVIMVVSLFGCCGGCCKAKCSLITVCFTSIMKALVLGRQLNIRTPLECYRTTKGTNQNQLVLKFTLECLEVFHDLRNFIAVFFPFQYIALTSFFLIVELIVVIIVYADEKLVHLTQKLMS